MKLLTTFLLVAGVALLLLSCASGVIAAIQLQQFGFGLVVVAILLRLLIAARGGDADAPNPRTHVRCPDCRELVRNDARKCKHCGAALTPQA